MLLAVSQQLCGTVRQDNLSGPGIGLGVACHQTPALFFVESAADAQSSFPPVKVRLHQSADLTQPQAGG